MTTLDIIDDGDWCHLTGVIMILLWLGRLLADERQRSWGVVLAMLAFVAFAVVALVRTPPGSGAELFTTSLQGLAVFGLALGAAWIVLPLLTGIGRFLARMIRALYAATSGWLRAAAQRRSDAKRRHREEDAWTQAAPERERAQKATQASAQTQAAAQKRREDVRAGCELLFHLHAHALGERFPRAFFDEFVQRYMGDGQTPEYVEQRGQQLTELVLQHARRVSSAAEESSLTALLAQHQEQLNQIENSPLDEEWKASLRAEIQQNFYEQLRNTLGNKP